MNSDFVTFAHRLADLSGERISRYFRKPHSAELKSDATPVTQADREAEEIMRAEILKTFPAHGIMGEEYGNHNSDADYAWVLDPVDGTRAFMAGLPTFGTLIALVHRGRPVLGIINQPVSHERWLGGDNLPSTLNGNPIATKKNVALKDAVISTTHPDLFKADEMKSFQNVSVKTARTIYGYDCYAYAMLASGHMDIVIETGLKPHDFCALAPVIENAGGVMTDWDGKPLTLASDGRVIAAANVKLHHDVMTLLSR